MLVYPISFLYLPGSESPAATRLAGLVLGYAFLDAGEIDLTIKRLAAAQRASALTAAFGRERIAARLRLGGATTSGCRS